MDPRAPADFRPFIARDDGTCLELLRRRGAGDWLLRGALYLLLVMTLGLVLLIPYGMWHKYRTFGSTRGWYAAPLLLLLSWFAVRLLLLGFHLESTRRIVCRPGELELEGRGALLRRREQLCDLIALEARAVRNVTRYRDVRWLRLRVRTASGSTFIGYLQLDPEAEPTREARAHAAAAVIAARLQVPLELRDEHDQPIWST